MGVPGVKRITLKADDIRQGRAMFRAVLARPWEFTGFLDFDPKTVDEKNYVSFQVTVERPSTTIEPAEPTPSAQE